VYDMHCDYLHCPPPAPAFCSCTTRNTMRSANTRPLLPCPTGPAPRTSPHHPVALPRPCPQHQAPVHLIYDRHQALPLLHARAHGHNDDLQRRHPRAPSARACTHPHTPHTPHRGRPTPTDASIPRPFHNRIHRFPRLPPQSQLPFAPLPACAALAVQCSTPSASETPRSNRRGCATSLRGAATCTSAMRHLPPRYEPAATRLRHHLMRAIALPTPCRTDTLDTTPARTPARIHTASPRPHVAFVPSALCDSLPPSPLDGRACHVLQYDPQHVPRLQRAPPSFLIAGAVFVAFSYAPTIYCLYRSTRGCMHPQHDTDVHSTCGSRSQPCTPRSSPPRTSCPSSALSQPSAQNLPWHAPRRRRARHARRLPPATVFSAAPPSAQRQVLSRSASMPRTPSVRSTRCSCSPSPTPLRPVPARTHHPQRRSALPARLTACTYLGSPEHYLRAPRTFPTVFAAPMTSDHRADPFRHAKYRPTPAPPVDNGGARASHCMR
jgi:hypothetical protein